MGDGHHHTHHAGVDHHIISRDIIIMHLVAYASDSSDDSAHPTPSHATHAHKRIKYTTAPDLSSDTVPSTLVSLSHATSSFTPPTLIAGIEQGLQGTAERDHLSSLDFNTQFHTFRALGYALNPALHANAYAGDIQRAHAFHGATVLDNSIGKHRSLPKRQSKGDPAVLDGDGHYLGPWAGNINDIQGQPQGAAEPTPLDFTRLNLPPPADEPVQEKTTFSTDTPGTERTLLHVNTDKDYLGRTYMHIPQDLGIDLNRDTDAFHCHLPRNVVHTWHAHTQSSSSSSSSSQVRLPGTVTSKGVSTLQFLPGSGHLLLSAGLDGSCKLFDIYHSRALLRSYLGHDRPIRDIHFSVTDNGHTFLSASYDRTVKHWDTETGACIRRFHMAKIPYCVRWHPKRPNVFLVAGSDRRIHQWDARTGRVQHVYNDHLAAVNSVCFVDEGRRFISSSDDKTIRVWEVGIPVVIKYIAEPEMHSMPVTLTHPSGKYLLCQSLDDQIAVYGTTKDRFRLHRDKYFKGHVVGSFAVGIACSPDGKYVSSGDAQGRVFHWDWKTGKIVQKWNSVHQGVTTAVAWHPKEVATVATCGSDGIIKLWR